MLQACFFNKNVLSYLCIVIVYTKCHFTFVFLKNLNNTIFEAKVSY